MNSITLNEIIDSAMQLPAEQREMLVEILTRRQIEERRHEIATDAEESIANYRTGEIKAQTAQKVIRELRQSLEDEE